VPFDNALATAGALKRTIKAIFAEVQIPVIKGLDLNLAARATTTPALAAPRTPRSRCATRRPTKLLFRGSYSTGFRVPTFKQCSIP
jgi:iron complex outermembrane receptor protein